MSNKRKLNKQKLPWGTLGAPANAPEPFGDVTWFHDGELPSEGDYRELFGPLVNAAEMRDLPSINIGNVCEQCLSAWKIAFHMKANIAGDVVTYLLCDECEGTHRVVPAEDWEEREAMMIGKDVE